MNGKSAIAHDPLRLIGAFLRDEGGATAIEYGLLASMIVVALVGMASMGGVTEAQNNTYNRLANTMGGS